MNGCMRAAFVLNGCADEIVDLCSAEQAWPATARLAFEGGSSSIPLLMPSTDGLRSSLDPMQSSERAEAGSSAAWRVREEDAMLLSCTQLTHV